MSPSVEHPPPPPLSAELLASFRAEVQAHGASDYFATKCPTCAMGLLLAELDRLAVENERLRQAIGEGVPELRAEHQRDEQVDGCLMCWPKDGHWPCTSAIIADDLAAAALPADPEPEPNEDDDAEQDALWAKHGSAFVPAAPPAVSPQAAPIVSVGEPIHGIDCYEAWRSGTFCKHEPEFAAGGAAETQEDPTS